MWTSVQTATACDGGQAGESVVLLDGGGEAYPRMLEAIRRARRSVQLQVYAFAPTGVGAEFIAALSGAARRGVAVRVLLDGWGSARSGRGVAAALRQAGCEAVVYHRLRALFSGHFGRNHRKILLVDDEVAFLGGINIGDENLDTGASPGWADLALEIRGPQCAELGRLLRRQPRRPIQTSLSILLSGLGGGWRLRGRYLRAFRGAARRIQVAHGYFVPDAGMVRALVAAARRGVEVRLLLAGRSDVPFARAATRSLYRRLLAAGVSIHEWEGSVLHAKIATVDGERLLAGSFNLDPFSLANMETLVEVADPAAVAAGEAWIEDHLARARPIDAVESGTWARRWLVDPIGRLLARLAELAGRALARRRSTRGPQDGDRGRAEAPR